MYYSLYNFFGELRYSIFNFFFYQLQSLRENHSKLFSQKEEEDATHRLNIQNLREKEKNNEKEFKRLQDEHTALNEYLTHLKDQLNKLQEQTYAAKEAVVIKESQVRKIPLSISSSSFYLSACP